MSKKRSLTATPSKFEELRIADSVAKELRRINYLLQDPECVVELAKNEKFFINHDLWLTRKGVYDQQWTVNVRTRNELETAVLKKDVPELKEYSWKNLRQVLSAQKWIGA